MNYLHKLCQLKFKLLWPIALIVFALGCSNSDKGTRKVNRAILAKATWFKAPLRFSYRQAGGEFELHPFFDLAPFAHPRQTEINIYLTTPENSKYGYELDLFSGKKYRKFNYCSQSDIWEAYSGKISRPSFSIGVVPRLLNQLGETQKIIIFGSRDNFVADKQTGVFSQRVRVVGGVVLQFCKNFPCLSHTNWLSKLVLVGVNRFDERYRNITEIEELIKHKDVDWKYVKAFLENASGRKLTGVKQEPAFRLLPNTISSKKALAFALKKGHFFKFEQMQNLRMSCHNLYDYLWRSVKRVRSQKIKNTRLDEARAYENQQRLLKKKKEEGTINALVTSPTVMKALPTYRTDIARSSRIDIEKKRHSNFLEFFFHFNREYGERFLTCQKFVQASNINENKERIWFFALFTNFLNLEKLGNYYSCSQKGWIKNPILPNGKRMYNTKVGSRGCNAKRFEPAFDSGITFMAGLRNSHRPHYSFIEYDIGAGGTGSKMYSWIYSNGKNIQCSESFGSAKRRAIFPVDVDWDKFN